MNLRRAAALAAILTLALPSAAYAGGGPVDSTGPSGQLITGSNLVTAVGGDVNSGGISVRFADSDVALFYYDNLGVDPGPQGAPGIFAIHEGGTAYSEEGTPYTPVSPPVLAGQGTVASPWTVSSAYATPDLGVTQQIAHVNGSRILKMTWTVTNNSGVSVPFKAFWSADLYVAGSDRGKGAIVSGSPRVLQGIAIDGTKVGLVELTPWSRYFEGGYWKATRVSWNPKTGYPDTISTHLIDNGFGVQWNRTLAPGASTTLMLGFNASEPGGIAVETPPEITRHPAATTPSSSATFAFRKHPGDAATVSYECSVDGGVYNPCTSPVTYTGLTAGRHVFRVHGLNAVGDFGPPAQASWRVTQGVAGSQPAVQLPSIAVAAHRMAARCGLGHGRIARCTVTLVGPGGVVLGRGEARFGTGHQPRHTVVSVALTGKGRQLAARPGGVRVVATATVLPAGASMPLVARHAVHVVAPRVDVTPGELQFRSGSSVLLPGGVRYLLGLVPQLVGARSVLATGYTDDLGSPEFNHQLGLDRAQAVCAFISQHAHVACDARSFGESHPRATNATAAGRAINRRVELRVTY
jgi:outer membrane protein OmpA-like peptidoglycan-associated protein